MTGQTPAELHFPAELVQHVFRFCLTPAVMQGNGAMVGESLTEGKLMVLERSPNDRNNFPYRVVEISKGQVTGAKQYSMEAEDVMIPRKRIETLYRPARYSQIHVTLHEFDEKAQFIARKPAPESEHISQNMLRDAYREALHAAQRYVASLPLSQQGAFRPSQGIA